MNRILIGYDGSQRGDDALALGRALAQLAAEPHVVVANVYEALMPKDSHGTPCLREQRLRDEALELLGRASSAWPELPQESFVAVRASSPSAGLHRLAGERDADVIVLGASHRSGLGRIWSGSATEQTLQGSPRPVAVAPPGYAAGHEQTAQIARIGLGYDSSDEARHALELAVPLAVAADATVVVIDVVHAEGPPLTDAYGYGSFLDSMREAADMHLADARAQLRNRGVARVETQRPEGIPSRELVAATAQLDLLVLGSRGHGPAMRLLLGSSSARVLREAACPVLAFPRSAASEGSADEDDDVDAAAATRT
jgi:nucleotide-binding universal stress UspA family protein